MNTENPSFTGILLAGGIGRRFPGPVPKQYLHLKDKPIALYSFHLLNSLPEVKEIAVVCSPEYQPLFTSKEKKIVFALPGERRQDSVFNGLQKLSEKNSLICIHDAARPLITPEIVRRTVFSASQIGAAAAAIPLKFTIKESDENHYVLNTPNRSKFWEIQTPQAIKGELLQKGFAKAYEENLTVTDDVSLIEHLGLPVKLVWGSYTNIKITTAEDFHFAQYLVNRDAALESSI